jgi:uncharacterized protein YcnI
VVVSVWAGRTRQTMRKETVVGGRVWRFAAAAGVASVVAVFGLAGAASAHVTVNPNSAAAGGYGRVAFRVPDESDTASTTKLEVQLPADEPFASVLVMPIPGWTATTETTKLATPVTTDDGDTVTEAITQITWTANSADTAVKPGQFQEFPVSLGPLPKSGSVTFKAVQTYSDGTIVRWIDPTVAGQPEPEHPAPVLKLSADPSGAATQAGTTSTTVSATKTDTSSATATTALVVGIVGLVVGLVGVGLAGLAVTRARRTAV